MDEATIKAMLASGTTPRELHQHAMAAHHDKIDREIAAGKWRCPVCREPMVRVRPTSAILVCPAASRGDH